MVDVYGIGNALVDFEFEVSDEELANLKVDKGVMTLIEADRHEELLVKLTGEQHKRACGGSAANTVIAVAQLGGQSFYSCKVGNDEPGQFYRDDLAANGVKSNETNHEADAGHTGKCIVMVTPDAERTMNTYLGISSQLSPAELDADNLARAKYCYIEGYVVSSETALAAALKCREIANEKGIKTAFSLSDPNMVKFFKPGLESIIGDKVDLLFANLEEAMGFTGTDALEPALEALKKVANTFAVTLGAEGAVLFDGETLIRVDAEKVKPVDTNGAGDLFAGAFLYGITQGQSFAEAGKLAAFAAGLLVTQFGPRLTPENLARVRERISG